MTTVESIVPEKCDICDQPHPWPDGTVPKHPFSNGEPGSTAFLGDKRRRVDPTQTAGNVGSQRGSEAVRLGHRAAYPIDPVLRQALVDKGILTPQDLRDAEEKIQMVTGLFNQSGPVMRGGSHE